MTLVDLRFDLASSLANWWPAANNCRSLVCIDQRTSLLDQSISCRTLAGARCVGRSLVAMMQGDNYSDDADAFGTDG